MSDKEPDFSTSVICYEPGAWGPIHSGWQGPLASI